MGDERIRGRSDCRSESIWMDMLKFNDNTDNEGDG
jgi:hypothetical protein